VERSILALKQEYPEWGAPKLREKLIRQYPQIPAPAISTVHAVSASYALSASTACPGCRFCSNIRHGNASFACPGGQMKAQSQTMFIDNSMYLRGQTAS
jgi:hypothetical protein